MMLNVCTLGEKDPDTSFELFLKAFERAKEKCIPKCSSKAGTKAKKHNYLHVHCTIGGMDNSGNKT
jgi:hypothetical protein